MENGGRAGNGTTPRQLFAIVDGRGASVVSSGRALYYQFFANFCAQCQCEPRPNCRPCGSEHICRETRGGEMSSTQVDRPTKVGNMASKKEAEKSRKLFNPSHKKHKHDESRHFKFGRKRLQNFVQNGKFFPPYKRRKNEGMIIPPTKFLLGGNICDPLNLNSMQDEEVNRAMNAVTPKSSPLPTPKHRKETIEVIIPPNICDPLNLSNCNNEDEEEYEKQLISPTKKGAKRRNRKRKRGSSGSGKDDGNDSIDAKSTEETSDQPETVKIEIPEITVEVTEAQEIPPEPILSPVPASTNPPAKIEQPMEQPSPQKDKNKLRLKGLDEIKDKRLRKVDLKDKIVSPVIPQPGAWKLRLPHRPCQEKKKKQQAQLPNFRAKDARYQYGNYNRYYGYRNPHLDVDTRLTVFSQRKELFISKDVLDIGCNIGHITLSVARDFAAHSVTGIDIDRKLIGIARKNVKHYVNCVSSPASNDDGNPAENYTDANFFPLSMPINYGPIDVPGFTKKDHKGFPYNVTFVQGNYVLDNDALLISEQPQFDTILCLSITKWIHLNFGDAGLKQAFKRMHAQLRPGGVLVLEPQGWASYGKKKNLTERTWTTYQSIEFFPQKFTQYLLSAEVGFTKCEVVSIPAHPSKGFQRPIQLFTKSGTSPVNAARIATSSGGSHGGIGIVDEVGNVKNSLRFVDRERKLKDRERRAFERDLFPQDLPKFGNLSELSQRSCESISNYEQLENVYAPSATPCYDTPSHNADSQPFEPEKLCYVDVNSNGEKPEATTITASSSRLSEAITKENHSETDNRTIDNKSNVFLHRKRRIEDNPVLSQKKSRDETEEEESKGKTDEEPSKVAGAIKQLATLSNNSINEEKCEKLLNERDSTMKNKDDNLTNHRRDGDKPSEFCVDQSSGYSDPEKT